MFKLTIWLKPLFVRLDFLFVPSKCQGGVQRVHIIDGSVDGSLLLELFTRDGAGTMIARYFEALLLSTFFCSNLLFTVHFNNPVPALSFLNMDAISWICSIICFCSPYY
jgi:hypothetical protein